MEIVLRLDRNWPISPNISTTTEPVFIYVSALIVVYMRIIKLTSFAVVQETLLWMHALIASLIALNRAKNSENWFSSF